MRIAPLLLHTGVASLEDHEPPYGAYYRLPSATARLVNEARANGRCVIAVGATSVRAPSPRYFTGFHEPRATHLATYVCC